MSYSPPFSKDAQARRAMMFIASIQQSSFKLRRSVIASPPCIGLGHDFYLAPPGLGS